jgi:hypothetical protein
VVWLGNYRPRQGENEALSAALIEAVAEKNPDRTVRGQALYAIALDAKRMFAVAERKKAPDLETQASRAEAAFEKVMTGYGDCPRLLRDDGAMLRDGARQELFELRHLRIGKPAPGIDGEDLDGVKFKLQDYRGKVVVLDFWGDW